MVIPRDSDLDGSRGIRSLSAGGSVAAGMGLVTAEWASSPPADRRIFVARRDEAPRNDNEPATGSYIFAMIASPNSLHFTSFAPSIWRAKS
jgi:hypothetical protein